MRRSEVKWNIAFFLTKRQGAFCEGVSLRTVCDKQNKECKKLVTAQPPKLLASPIYMQSHNHNNYDGFHLKMFQHWSQTQSLLAWHSTQSTVFGNLRQPRLGRYVSKRGEAIGLHFGIKITAFKLCSRTWWWCILMKSWGSLAQWLRPHLISRLIAVINSWSIALFYGD